MSNEAIEAIERVDGKRVKGVDALLPPPEITEIRATKGTDTVAALSKGSTTVLLPSERPQIPAPNTTHLHPALIIGRLQKRAEEVSDRTINVIADGIEEILSELYVLHQKQLEALNAAALQVQNSNTWGTLQNIGSYILQSFTFIGGVACVSTGAGAAVGFFLIASGGIGLFNNIMVDSGGWELVARQFTQNIALQKTLAHQFALGLMLTSWGTGIYAFASGAALVRSLASMEKMGEVCHLVGCALWGSGHLGKGLAEQEKSIQDAKLMRLTNKESLLTRAIESSATDAQIIEQGSEQLVRIAKEAVERTDTHPA